MVVEAVSLAAALVAAYAAAAAQHVVRVALADGQPLQRGRLAGTLWPGSTDRRAGASLRSTLCELRRVTPMVQLDETTMTLPAAVEVDWCAAVRVATAIIADRPDTSPERALELLRHRLLPDWCEEWLDADQLRFDDLRLHALERLSEDLSSQGKHAMAVQAAITAIHQEPYRESAHRALVRAYLGEGNQAAALRHYQRFADDLSAELGVPPSPGFTRLVMASA